MPLEYIYMIPLIEFLYIYNGLWCRMHDVLDNVGVESVSVNQQLNFLKPIWTKGKERINIVFLVFTRELYVICMMPKQVQAWPSTLSQGGQLWKDEKGKIKVISCFGKLASLLHHDAELDSVLFDWLGFFSC